MRKEQYKWTKSRLLTACLRHPSYPTGQYQVSPAGKGIFTLLPVNMSIQTNLFINNEYLPSSTGETLSIYSPSDDSLVSDQIQVASEADVDKAVAAAKAAFHTWWATPGPERGRIMLKFADLLERDAKKLAKLESMAMGLPISVSTRLVHSPAAIWRYYAGFSDKLAGESYPPDGDGMYKIVAYEPLGVCSGICAWNVTHILAGSCPHSSNTATY